jgi:hypothetical protein
MGWRNVSQTNVKDFIESSNAFTDSVFTRAIAMEGLDKVSWNWTRAQDKLTPAAGYSMWGEGGFKYDSLN